MRKFMILIIALIMSTVMCVSTAIDAHAHDGSARRCVTVHEYHHAHKGDTRKYVHMVWDTKGTSTEWLPTPGDTRMYTMCNGDYAMVQYMGGVVVAKERGTTPPPV